jgi:hypothetical protein
MLPTTSAIFYTPLKRELIGRLWGFGVNQDPAVLASVLQEQTAFIVPDP